MVSNCRARLTVRHRGNRTASKALWFAITDKLSQHEEPPSKL